MLQLLLLLWTLGSRPTVGRTGHQAVGSENVSSLVFLELVAFVLSASLAEHRAKLKHNKINLQDKYFL